MNKKKDNVLKFQKGGAGQTNQAATASKENPFLAEAPKEADGSDGYTMTNVNYSHSNLKTMPDLVKGGKRNKRWGASVALGIIPALDTMPVGPVVVPETPAQFFDADDLPTLRARLIHEIDKAISLASMQVESPEEFERCYAEYMETVGAAVGAEHALDPSGPVD